MRHRKSGVKLNRTTSHRQAMFRNMVTSLFKYERIRTTDAKAKELRRWADHVIGLAKRGDLHARRQAMAVIREKAVVHKLFEEAEKRFGPINGGYTRIVKIGRRPGDAAPVSIIELVSVDDRTPKTKKKKTAPVPKKKAKTEAATTKEQTAPEPEKTADAKADASTEAEAVDQQEAAPAVEENVADTDAEASKEATAETAPAEADPDSTADKNAEADDASGSEDSEKKD
jgi:large subunit ribosomal protein L17